MPKETIKERNGRKSATIEVRWGPEHYNIIQVEIDRKSKFRFQVPETDPDYNTDFTSLCLMLDNKEDVSRLIKALQKAKRKTFK